MKATIQSQATLVQSDLIYISVAPDPLLSLPVSRDSSRCFPNKTQVQKSDWSFCRRALRAVATVSSGLAQSCLLYIWEITVLPEELVCTASPNQAQLPSPCPNKWIKGGAALIGNWIKHDIPCFKEHADQAKVRWDIVRRNCHSSHTWPPAPGSLFPLIIWAFLHAPLSKGIKKNKHMLWQMFL